MPVLKQLIALPGDIVEVTSTDIIVNGQMYPAKIHTRDHQGRILKRQIFKKSVVDNYWLYGTASENSWDSRYYGGVDRNNIIGIYLPTRLPKWIRQSSRHEETK